MRIIPEVVDKRGLGGGVVGDIGAGGVHFVAFGEETEKMGLFGGGEFGPDGGVEEVLIVFREPAPDRGAVLIKALPVGS